MKAEEKAKIYVDELKEKFQDKIRVDLTTFKNRKTKCKHFCKIHGEFWKTPRAVLISLCGCGKCGRMQSALSHIKNAKSIEDELYKIHGDSLHMDLSTFIKKSTYAEFDCAICGCHWKAKVSEVLRKDKPTGCPNCACNFPVSLEEAEKRLDKVSEGKYKILNKENYIGSISNLDFLCIEHNCIWNTCIADIWRGKSHCPKCVMSKLEKPIYNLLKEKNCNFKHDEILKGCYYKTPAHCLRSDFLIESDNTKLVIETDGRQHFEPIRGEDRLQYIKTCDSIKNKYLKDNNFILIRITSSHTKEWGTDRHLTLIEGIHLINKGIDKNGHVDINIFKRYDFNRK
jgi:very-short-patch-repair endonuclease